MNDSETKENAAQPGLHIQSQYLHGIGDPPEQVGSSLVPRCTASGWVDAAESATAVALEPCSELMPILASVNSSCS